MTPAWVVALAGLLYGCAAFLATRACDRICAGIEPFEDGPGAGRPPTALLVAGAAVIGGVLAARDPLPSLLALGVLVVALAACWYCDVRAGIVPDWFTLGPLAIVLAISLARADPAPAISAAVVFTPFALAALLSKGRGMGWGDVKLVALGAAALGLRLAVLAFAAACLAAVVVAAARRRRGEPIAFAPYLSGCIALALAMPL